MRYLGLKSLAKCKRAHGLVVGYLAEGAVGYLAEITLE